MKLTYLRKYFEKSDSDWKDGEWFYEFTINDSDSKDSYKETKLLKNVSFVKGESYKIKLGDRGYPVEVKWEDGRVYMKNNNSIIKVNEKGEETNLSKTFLSSTGRSNYEKGIFNKFIKGILTEDLLLKINARNKYFCIKVIDPQDRRKSIYHSYGYSETNENYVLVKYESQELIDETIENIKKYHLGESLHKYFVFKFELLPIKKRRKK